MSARLLRFRGALALALIVTAARLIYLKFWCPYHLVEDEAFYWEWSRRLEWSYYSKGPGVAWTIAACEWLGQRLGLSSTEFLVRVPAVLFGGVLLVAVGLLARRTVKHDRAAFIAMAAVLLAPAFQWAAILMTIDGPYMACWALAALCAHAALRRGSGIAWIGLGAALGAGFLYKYTQVLLIPGIALFAIKHRRELKLNPRWSLWLLGCIGVMAASCTPVFIYNARHDWVTVRHLIGHLGLIGGDVSPPPGQVLRFNPLGTLQLIGSQLPLVGPSVIVMGWGVARLRRRGNEVPDDRAADLAFLVSCGLPVLAFYLFISFLGKPQGNWPLAGYVTLFPFVSWAVIELGRLPRAGLAWVRASWSGAIIVGVGVCVCSVKLDWIAEGSLMRGLRDIVARQGMVAHDRPLIPLGRLIGSATIGRSAESLRDRVGAETGSTPFIIAQHYGRAAQLAYYIGGHPTVYCSSSKSEGRKSQYDLWSETSLDDPALLGRPAVLVGGRPDQWEPAFERVVEVGPLEGETKKDRKSYVGYGYHGFPASAVPAGTDPR